jgi:hypothetical protein
MVLNRYVPFEEICGENKIIHCGIVHDPERLLLHVINNGSFITLGLLLGHNAQIKDYYLFKCVETDTNCNRVIFIQEFIKKGADPYYKYNGKTLLQYAIEKKRNSLVNYLNTHYKYL